MKKIMLLLITVMFLTGCNVEYNLTISKDNISESINLISEDYEESDIINLYQKPIEAFNNSPVYSESFLSESGYSLLYSGYCLKYPS